jgi:glycerol kinase
LVSGFYDRYADLIAARQVDRVFEPGEGEPAAQANFELWLKAVSRAKGWIED